MQASVEVGNALLIVPTPMNIAEFLSPATVMHGLHVSGKKKLLGELATMAAKHLAMEPGPIFETLWEREKLGSTGVGHGIAIPHGRIENLNRIVGVFAQLHKPVDYESIDDVPIDLVFLLLTPSDAGADHLKALAKISRVLRNPGTCEKLRNAADEKALYAVLIEPPAGSQAA
jgi:PTS system nitrogen regulatory IIA component